MKRFFATAVTCLLSALLMPPLTASAHNVLVSPDNFPEECRDDIFDEAIYSGPVSVYIVRNLMQHNEDPYKIKFQISGGEKIEFYTEFPRDTDPEVLDQIDGYIKKKKGLFVAFVQPGTAHLGADGILPASGADSILDFFLIGSIRMGNGNPPMCASLTQPVGLPNASYGNMPPNIQRLMDRSKTAMAETIAKALAGWNDQTPASQPVVYRNFTTPQMVDACGAGFINEYLHPLMIGYKVTSGESGLGTGHFYFTVEGGSDDIRYEIDESDLTVATRSMLNVLGKQAATLPENEQREKLFAVFGPPADNSGNVSIMLVRSDNYPTKRCMPMTPLRTVTLLPQHMPEKVREERSRPEAGHIYIATSY